MEVEKDKQIKKIALLVSCAAVLQIAESLIPHPVPGVRLGLANMITLVALVTLGFRAAVEVAVLRTIVSSFILGTFLSPSFILSFTGALISTLIMGLFYKLSTLNHKLYFSLIGISLLGAITHNLVQISLVYLLLIRHQGIFLLLPWLGISAVIMGWITGLVASQVCQKLENSCIGVSLKENKTTAVSSFMPQHYIHLNSRIHLLSPALKIISVFILALIVLFLDNFLSYTVVLFFLFCVAYLAKISFSHLFSGIRKLSSFLFFSFATPVFFNRNGEILSNLGFLKITQGGLSMGSMFVFRLVLLMLSASLLIRTTSPDDLAAGLKRILSPLKLFGISGDRIGAIITSSWLSIPVFWERTRSFIQNQKLNGKAMKKLIPALSGLIVKLYQQTDESTEEI